MVCDRDQGVVLSLADGDRDLTLRIAVLRGVGNDVTQDLLDPCRIGQHWRDGSGTSTCSA